MCEKPFKASEGFRYDGARIVASYTTSQDLAPSKYGSREDYCPSCFKKWSAAKEKGKFLDIADPYQMPCPACGTTVVFPDFLKSRIRFFREYINNDDYACEHGNNEYKIDCKSCGQVISKKFYVDEWPYVECGYCKNVLNKSTSIYVDEVVCFHKDCVDFPVRQRELKSAQKKARIELQERQKQEEERFKRQQEKLRQEREEAYVRFKEEKIRGFRKDYGLNQNGIMFFILLLVAFLLAVSMYYFATGYFFKFFVLGVGPAFFFFKMFKRRYEIFQELWRMEKDLRK
ncbi:MAG: hypothetical protein F6J87_00385 [Spirulina sp. SIO3F2]|nr:hypothetical protein [Spirulina sp. SIO3F2]